MWTVAEEGINHRTLGKRIQVAHRCNVGVQVKLGIGSVRIAREPGVGFRVGILQLSLEGAVPERRVRADGKRIAVEAAGLIDFLTDCGRGLSQNARKEERIDPHEVHGVVQPLSHGKELYAVEGIVAAELDAEAVIELRRLAIDRRVVMTNEISYADQLQVAAFEGGTEGAVAVVAREFFVLLTV